LPLPRGRLYPGHSRLHQVKQPDDFGVIPAREVEVDAVVDFLKHVFDLDSHFVVPADFENAGQRREDVFWDGVTEVHQPIKLAYDRMSDKSRFREVGEPVGPEDDFDLAANVGGEAQVDVFADAAVIGAGDDKGVEFVNRDFADVRVGVTERDVGGGGGFLIAAPPSVGTCVGVAVGFWIAGHGLTFPVRGSGGDQGTRVDGGFDLA